MSEQQGPGFTPPSPPAPPAYLSYPPPVAAPSPWLPAGPPAVPSAAMPGTVRAATIITYVCVALTVAMTFLMAMFVLFVGSFIYGAFEGSDRAEAVLILVAVTGAVLALCALGLWFAVQTGRRRNWARIGLAALSGLTVVLSLLAFAPPTLVGILGGTAVLVLLFLPESNAWFRDADSP